jgi:hypothetical protein
MDVIWSPVSTGMSMLCVACGRSMLGFKYCVPDRNPDVMSDDLGGSVVVFDGSSGV